MMTMVRWLWRECNKKKEIDKNARRRKLLALMDKVTSDGWMRGSKGVWDTSAS